jgi:hypothetical protein
VYKSNKTIQDAYIRLKNEAVYGVYGKRYIPKNDDGTNDYTKDFPNLEDPTDYVTHIPLEQEKIEEAEKGKSTTKIEDKMKAEEGDFELPEGESESEEEVDIEDTSSDEGEGGEAADVLNADPSAAGAEGGAGGMLSAGQPEPEKITSNSLGRVYELKKIYSRLSSVESFLSRTTDENILEIRKMISNSIDLFELVISNFEQYKENIDEIIVTYYEFLKVVYESIRNHFKRVSDNNNIQE